MPTYILVFGDFGNSIDFYDINKNNKIVRMRKDNLIGRLYEPHIFKKLYKLLNKNLNNGQLQIEFVNKISVFIVNKSKQESVISLDKLLFKDNQLFIVDVYGVQYDINELSGFHTQQFKVNGYLEIMRFLKFNDYLNIDESDKDLLLGFYKEFDYYSVRENAIKSSRYFFINANDHERLSKDQILLINLMNIYVEFFVFFKHFMQKTDGLSYSYIFSFAQSLVPNKTLNFDAFTHVFPLLNTSCLFNGKDNGYYDSFVYRFMFDNIKMKYDDVLIENFLKVIIKVVDEEVYYKLKNNITSIAI